MHNNTWLYISLIALSILFWRGQHNLRGQLELSRDELSSCEDYLDQANSNIEDAQSYAWSSYEEMGYALDNLETVY